MKKTKKSYDITSIILANLISLIFIIPLSVLSVIENKLYLSLAFVVAFTFIVDIIIYHFTSAQLVFTPEYLIIKKHDIIDKVSWDSVRVVYYDWDMIFILKPRTMNLKIMCESDIKDFFVPCTKKTYEFILGLTKM